MRSHPVVEKLQTLPLLYAGPNDLVLVSCLPPSPDPRLILIGSEIHAERIEDRKIEDWGASLAIQKWAAEQRIPYRMPDWDAVRAVNSKVFSFTRSPRLPSSELLETEKEALLWIEKTPGPKVLKTPFGTAGRGHFLIPGSSHLPQFLRKELAKGPLIGEPWVERILDFSTQWKDGELLGATRFENAPNGSYRATLAGPRETVFAGSTWALEEHLAAVQPLLQEIHALGFFGHLGIDAFIYKRNGKEALQPVVEINGRKTMSWAALKIQEKTCPGKILCFSFSPSGGIALENG